MYSVMLLIASFGALSGLYILLDAPFVAVTQIIVYAGAIMVLFLFVVMLLNAPQEDAAEWDRHAIRCNAAGVARRFGALLGGRARRASSSGRWHVRAAARRRRRRPRRRSVSSVRDDRPRALHRLRVRVRGDVDADPGGDGRRRGAGAARKGMRQP